MPTRAILSVPLGNMIGSRIYNANVHATWVSSEEKILYHKTMDPAYFFAGIYAMPVAVSGRPLPNPRVLSTRLFSDQPIASRVLTYMNMQWGQLVTHDLLFQVMEVTG